MHEDYTIHLWLRNPEKNMICNEYFITPVAIRRNMYDVTNFFDIKWYIYDKMGPRPIAKLK